MSNLIMKGDGTPYDEKTAKMRQGALRKRGQDTEVVEVEGGFALKRVRRIRKKSGPMRWRDSLFIKDADKDPNYVYRIFNSDDDRWQGRVETAEEYGWEVVEGVKMGEPKAGDSKPVGSATEKPVGHGVTGVLMRIPREFYEEDKKSSEEKRQEKEDQFRNAHKQEGFYAPEAK